MKANLLKKTLALTLASGAAAAVSFTSTTPASSVPINIAPYVQGQRCAQYAINGAAAGFNVILGTGIADTITGTAGPDVILTFAGDDKVDGMGGNDIILTYSGRDQARGNFGMDTICLGRDNDDGRGGDQNDRILGEEGDDRLSGDAGTNDVGNGGLGFDVCSPTTEVQISC